MNTFKAWLIANIEVIFIVLQVLFFVIFCLTSPDMGEVEKKAVYIIFAIVFIAGMIWGLKSWIPEFFIIVAILAIVLYVILGKDMEISIFVKAIISIVTVLSLIIGGVVAVSAYRNFDEVVSRRFLFRNSNASVFETQMKYAFSRFYTFFTLTLFFAVEIITFVAAARNI